MLVKPVQAGDEDVGGTCVCPTSVLRASYVFPIRTILLDTAMEIYAERVDDSILMAWTTLKDCDYRKAYFNAVKASDQSVPSNKHWIERAWVTFFKGPAHGMQHAMMVSNLIRSVHLFSKESVTSMTHPHRFWLTRETLVVSANPTPLKRGVGALHQQWSARGSVRYQATSCKLTCGVTFR